MNVIITCFLIAISLSMDAFSLSLAYGMYGFSLKKEILLSCIVGIFHFFMPLFGFLLGNIIIKYFIFDLNLLVGIIFLIIGIEMIVSFKNNSSIKIIDSLSGFLLFGLSVSVDSFTTGIGLVVISKNYIGVSFIFMLVSGLFTYAGLRLGDRISKRFGKYAMISGGVLMCLLGMHQMLGKSIFGFMV